MNGIQRYRCKNCKKTQIHTYRKNAYRPGTDASIAAHVKEGCGIRSIARLLHIAAGTVLYRIQKIANDIKKPAISTERTYEVDELKTYPNAGARVSRVLNPLDRQPT